MAEELYDPGANSTVVGGGQPIAQPDAESDPAATSRSLLGTGFHSLPSDTRQGQIADDAQVRDALARSWTSLYTSANPPPQPSSQTPVSAVIKDAAGSVARGAAGVGDIITNPSELVLRPLRTAGAAAYDWLGPKVGLPQLTPEQRQDLLGGAGPVTGALSMIPGPNPMTTGPQTQIGSKLDAPIQSAVGAAALGPGGFLRRTALGAAGGAAGEAAANAVPDRYAPLVGMATNALVQAGGAAALPRPGASIDPADASVAQNAQTKFGIPFRAPDVTPSSILRTAAQDARLNDSLRGNIVTQMGENPITNDAATTNKVTPDVLNSTRLRTGQVIENIGQNNDIQPGPAFNLLTRLRQLDADVNGMTGVSDTDRSIMHTRLAEIRNAVDPATGTISGTGYLGLTQTGSRLDKLAGAANPDVANIGLQAADALHDAMGASLTPDQRAALTQAKYQYRVMKTVEPLVADDRTGNIDAGQFSRRVARQSMKLDTGGNRAAMGGGGDLSELGDAARLISKASEPRSLNPIPALMAAPASAAVPWLLGRPLSEVIAAQFLPSAMQIGPAAVMRGAPYAADALRYARNPVDPLTRGLLAIPSGITQ